MTRNPSSRVRRDTEGATPPNRLNAGSRDVRRSTTRQFPRRLLVGGAIVGFWLLMMGLLLQREVFGSLLRGTVIVNRDNWVDEPTESWLTLHGPQSELGEQQPKQAESSPQSGSNLVIAANRSSPEVLSFGPRVGYAHLRQEPLPRDGLEGVQISLEVHLTLRLLGRQASLDLSGTAWRARRQRLAHIDFSIHSGEADFRLVGKIIDNGLQATVESGGEVTDFKTRLADNALFSTGFGTGLAFPPIELGQRVVLQAFDPMTLRASRTVVRAVSRSELEVDGAKIPATRLEVRSAGLKSFAWIDHAGQVLQATTPLGLSLRRSTKEMALREINAPDNASELLRITAIKPTGPRPRRGARVLEMRIPGVVGWDELTNNSQKPGAETSSVGPSGSNDETALAIPLDWRQHALGASRFRIEASGLSPRAIGEIGRGVDSEPTPATFGTLSTLTTEQLHQYLSADAFIQSDHPKIRNKAEEIVGLPGADDNPLQWALALHDWVFSALEKEPVLSLPSALEVLASRRGDCNEHTILYTALARSIGLPTRVAIGLVWSDVYDGFYYHAWPEVWLNQGESENGQRTGYWIALDPTLGQSMADATHIKLLEGSIDRWTQLLPFLGQLQIEMIETPDHDQDSNPHQALRQ